MTIIITENMLDDWVRGHARDAQGVIVELVWRLVCASSPQPKERRFPLSDSIGQHGPDGFLNADIPYKPYISIGKSYWEIGTNVDAAKKATADYKSLTEETPNDIKSESTFIFVTPLSGRRGWEDSWKEKSQGTWLKTRRNKKEWLNVEIIDGTKLVEWLHYFPAVELWMASKMGLPWQELESPEIRWDTLRSIGEPPPLTPLLFTVNRQRVCEYLQDFFNRKTSQLQLDSHFPDQIVDMVSAFISTLEGDLQKEISGRCIIANSYETLLALSQTTIHNYFIITSLNLSEQDSKNTRLIQRLRTAGHSLIYAGSPGGVPNPSRIFVNNPKPFHLQDTLVKAGYNSGRAHKISLISAGNIGVLLRCIQNLSIMPEWSQDNQAADLAIAEILGAWNEKNSNDINQIEILLGKSYREWIEVVQYVKQRPNTPISYRDGVWKFIARYEGWYSLGEKIHISDLEKIKQICLTVLTEIDPVLAFPKEERWHHSHQLTYSFDLRRGLAETLALIGSHPNALTHCSNRAVSFAHNTIQLILKKADWKLWASLNDVLPLLAEAAPNAFMNAIEYALQEKDCPIDVVFQQESSGIGGRTYITGLIWGLETLAWSKDYFNKAMLLLAALANRDKGGQWSNRPKYSLTTIILPWLPQTLASPSARKSILELILKKYPNVGWNLLLSVLPTEHSVSDFTRKPAWQDFIPDDWSESVSYQEYYEQIKNYTEMLTSFLTKNSDFIPDIINRLHLLPIDSQNYILDLLESDAISSLVDDVRVPIWNCVLNTAIHHKKFSDAEWAFDGDFINRLFEISKNIEPDDLLLKYERYFAGRDYDLVEEVDLEDRSEVLLKNKKDIVFDIYNKGGFKLVIDLAKAVTMPYQVGFAFGSWQLDETLKLIIPTMITSEENAMREFVGGYVRAWYVNKGWKWVEEQDFSLWKKTEIGQFLAYLPFTEKAWELSSLLLKDDESPYWNIANANPYETKNDLQPAIIKLLKYERSIEALRCLRGMLYNKQIFAPDIALEALNQIITRQQLLTNTSDTHSIIELIEYLQKYQGLAVEVLEIIEWRYLKLLDKPSQARPITLWRKLAKEPKFFCEMLSLIYYSDHLDDNEIPESSSEQKKIASNAYRLFDDWEIVPGSNKEFFDVDFFKFWFDEVKKSTIDSGHLDVALLTFGKVLIHSPADPNGLWIHSAIAEALDADDARPLRNSFCMAFFNARGVYSPSGGMQERRLATKYIQKAEAVEAEGFINLGSALRNLASGYERDAVKDEERGWFDQ